MRIRSIPTLTIIGVVLVAGVTVLHYLCWYFSPFDFNHPIGPVWLSIIIFQSILISTIVLCGSPAIKRYGNSTFDWQTELSALPIERLLCISFVGIVIHLLAKAQFIHMTPRECITIIRELWINHDRSHDPVWIRISSILGHVGSQFAIPGAMLAGFQITYGRRSWRRWLILVGFVGIIVVYAGSIMSRSTVMSALTLIFLGITLGLSEANTTFLSRVRRGGSVLATVLIIAILFNLVVFNSKISCGPKNEAKYVNDNLVNTGLKAKIGNSKKIRSYNLRMAPTLIYANHGLANFAIIHDTQRRGSPLLLGFVEDYLQRINIGSVKEKKIRVHSRGGATLPGAAYHDYGYPGLVCTALVVGLSWSVGSALLSRGGRWGFVGLTFLAGTALTIALSMLFVAPATMSFPFIIFAFLASILCIIPKPNRKCQTRSRKGSQS